LSRAVVELASGGVSGALITRVVLDVSGVNGEGWSNRQIFISHERYRYSLESEWVFDLSCFPLFP
jgi:hypothetical protein